MFSFSCFWFHRLWLRPIRCWCLCHGRDGGVALPLFANSGGYCYNDVPLDGPVMHIRQFWCHWLWLRPVRCCYLCHRATRDCSATTVTSSLRATLRCTRVRPCPGNKVYKALGEHWIYDSSDPVLPGQPPRDRLKSAFTRFKPTSIPGQASSFCPPFFRDPRYCGPQTCLKGKRTPNTL